MTVSTDLIPGYWRARALVRKDANDFARAAEYEAIADKLERKAPLAAIPEYQAERKRVVTWARAGSH